ncbi:MAG: hypothetical protein M1817_006868 [Caeruleum heppii]|nr:MAG: hypothetical protein M1817_006868 [Caeruleum heppii]
MTSSPPSTTTTTSTPTKETKETPPLRNLWTTMLTYLFPGGAGYTWPSSRHFFDSSSSSSKKHGGSARVQFVGILHPHSSADVDVDVAFSFVMLQQMNPHERYEEEIWAEAETTLTTYLNEQAWRDRRMWNGVGKWEGKWEEDEQEGKEKGKGKGEELFAAVALGQFVRFYDVVGRGQERGGLMGESEERSGLAERKEETVRLRRRNERALEVRDDCEEVQRRVLEIRGEMERDVGRGG